MRVRRIALCALAALWLASPLARAAQNDAYAAMLGYLTASRMDGNTLNGSSGAIAVNLGAGDLNQQANLRAVAIGTDATVSISAQQQQAGVTATAPDVATASIGGGALGHASGLISINQASGTANAELNTASIVLAQPDTRATSADEWLAGVCACGQQAAQVGPGRQGTGTKVHAAAVDAEAMSGLQGVVQLNQIAGSNNVTANHLTIEAATTPR